MLSIGRSRMSAILIAGLTGAVEPIGALLGVTLVSTVHGLLPVGMGWAAGAMLYICAAELIPAVHEDARTTGKALTAVLIGIAGMLFLDTALAA
jgi:zinc transporter, ZIP family